MPIVRRSASPSPSGIHTASHPVSSRRPAARCASGMNRESLNARTAQDRKSTRLNSSHSQISYAVFCLKKKKNKTEKITNTEQGHKLLWLCHVITNCLD